MDLKSVHKLVHLDLKGAPPKLSYYEWFFELIRRLGATGVLLEYEDMFPFSGHLEKLKLPHAYSTSDVQQLRDTASKHNLTIVPLVQTFGHLEFLLKHKEFIHLNEGKDPFSICATSLESLEVLKVMIAQVVDLHPEITYFHIGADEVYQLGECQHCQQIMLQQNVSKVHLFLGHVTRLLRYLRGEYPRLKWIMWDDMLRQMDGEVLKDSGLGELVEPMVWDYTPTVQISPATWSTFSKVFPSYWVASAFKGATGIDRFYTDIQYHIDNHESWMRVVERNEMTLSGISLTGWQRYTHFHPFCELLPTAIPSLTICLLTIQKGKFTEECKKEAEDLLKFTTPLQLNPVLDTSTAVQCTFPGSEVYKQTHKLLSLYTRFDKVLHTQKHLFNQEELLAEKESILRELQQMGELMGGTLTEIFPAATAQEWVSYHIEALHHKWNAIDI